MASSRKWRAELWGVWLLLCLAAGGSSPARAQTAAPHGASRPTWAAWMADTLKLDARQLAAFGDYAAALSDGSAQTPGVSADQFRAMTTPERYDYMAGHTAVDLKILTARSRAAHRFYDMLTDAQRKRFDAAVAPPGGGGAIADVVTQPQPDKPDYRLPSWTAPDWLVKPTADIISRLYPTAAQAGSTPGRAQITCTVDIDGYLTDCVVDFEDPKNLGFGNAALEMSAYFRMLPATTYGVPVPSTVTVPLNFTALPQK